MKITKKIIRIIIFIILFGLFLYLLNVARLNIQYLVYKSNYKESFKTIGNKDNYVPQGLCYSDKYNVMLQTSYNGKHNVSMLYVIDFKTGKTINSLELKDMEGNNQTNHVGGIATDNETVWITNDYQVEEYSLKDIMDTNNKIIQSNNITPLPIRGDFCTFHDNTLWIGDFYLKPFYDVPNGNPLLLGYNGNSIDYAKPDVVISLPKMVQGLTFNDKNEFVFTRSFTYLVLSDFSIYENILDKKADSTIRINNKGIPYYKLTKNNLVKEIKLPPMAEGLFYKNNSYYILFESSTDYYPMASPKINNIIQYKTDK